MKKYICVHCHFYQPPRENPWLEAIEVQDLAAPYHDWNARINAECYAPNSASRILNKDKKIIDIVNNYDKISFNFGPTLLSWLELKDPQTYSLILEADKRSVGHHSGHGNAIAQAYNHMIMPLADRSEKITQIIWGIEDFKYRFKRNPEGMWLPETAVDMETLEILADHGIRFTILSPYQAKRIRDISNSNKDWIQIDHGNIDPSRGYLCHLKDGKSITLFFYDSHISQAVAFEGLLNDGSKFANRLMMGYSDSRKHDQFLHIATDGETYGHHFKFGEMALTYALNDLAMNHNVQFSNYGEYLENHPVEFEVEINENTSWSCFHGVGRWKEDCGCKLSNHLEWNQKWRKPLRDSLDDLNKNLREIYNNELSVYMNDPSKIRNEYINIVLDRTNENIISFFQKHSKRQLSDYEKIKSLKLLEMQRQSMLMFTSCGWFFDDISGIETVQILKHACRAIQLANELGYGLENDFIHELSIAESNINTIGNGKAIYDNFVKPSEVDLKRVIAHHAMSSLISKNNSASKPFKTIFSYEVQQEDYLKSFVGNMSFAIGRVKVRSTITSEEEDAVFSALHLGLHDFQCKISGINEVSEYERTKHILFETFQNESITQLIRKLDSHFPGNYHSLKELFVEERRKILSKITEGIFSSFQQNYVNLYQENKRLMEYHLKLEASIHEEFRKAVIFVLSNRLHEKIEEEKNNGGSRDYSKELKSILEESKMWYIELDKSMSSKTLDKLIFEKINSIKESWSLQLLIDIYRYISISKHFSIPVSMWHFQNDFFSVIKETPSIPETDRDQAQKLFKEIEILLDMQIIHFLQN